MLRGPLHYGKDYSVFSEFDSESDSLVRAGTQAQRHMVMTNDKLFNKTDCSTRRTASRPFRPSFW
jgi:hypothetical protein